MYERFAKFEEKVLGHEKDLRTLKRVLNAVDWPAVIRLTRQLPFGVEYEFLAYHDVFFKVVEQEGISFSDQRLQLRFRTICDLWAKLYFHSQLLLRGFSGYFIYSDLGVSAESDVDGKKVETQRRLLILAVAKLLTDVVIRFPEIQLEKLAWSRQGSAAV